MLGAFGSCGIGDTPRCLWGDCYFTLVSCDRDRAVEMNCTRATACEFEHVCSTRRRSVKHHFVFPLLGTVCGTFVVSRSDLNCRTCCGCSAVSVPWYTTCVHSSTRLLAFGWPASFCMSYTRMWCGVPMASVPLTMTWCSTTSEVKCPFVSARALAAANALATAATVSANAPTPIFILSPSSLGEEGIRKTRQALKR
jgi:hypothetical protein